MITGKNGYFNSFWGWIYNSGNRISNRVNKLQNWIIDHAEG